MENKTLNSGPVGPLLVKLALPVLAGQAFGLLYNLADTYFIARIDTSDPWLVGATGLVFPLYFFFMAASFGITGGISSLVARAIGANRSSELDKTAESGLFLALAFSALVLLVMYPLATPLLKLFGGKDLLLAYGLEYFVWILPAVPFMLLNAVFTGILQGEGRTKHMMVSMMIGTTVNIVLDPLFIFTFRMGIAGAGFATALGNAAGFVYLLIVFVRTSSKVKIHWKFANISFPVIAEILRVGVPQSMVNFLASISFIFYNRIMTDINPMIITSFTLYSRLEQIALIPIWAISSALSAISGQAAGGELFARMKDSGRKATVMGLSVGGMLLVIFALSSRFLFSLFQSDAGVLDIAGKIVPWMALATFVSIPIFMISTVMSTSGFANRSLALAAIRIYAFNVPACFIGAYLIGKTISSVMIAIFVSAVLSFLLAYAMQRSFFKGLVSGKIRVRLSAPLAENDRLEGSDDDLEVKNH